MNAPSNVSSIVAVLLLLLAAPLGSTDTMETRMGIPGSADGILVDHPLSWEASVWGPAHARTLLLVAPGSPRLALLVTTVVLHPDEELTRSDISDLASQLAERQARNEPGPAAVPRLLEMEGEAAWGFYSTVRDPRGPIPDTDYRYTRVGALVVGPIVVGFHLLSDERVGPLVAAGLAAVRSLRPDSLLPSAPSGFEWIELEAIGARILKPRGWNEHSDLQGETRRYAFSREPLAGDGSFKTGLSIQVISDATATFGRLAPNAARAHLAAARRQPGVGVASTWSEAFGRIQVHGHVILRPDAAGLAGIVVAQLAIGDPDTDTLYLLRFETPEAMWEKGDGEIALSILGHFVLAPRA